MPLVTPTQSPLTVPILESARLRLRPLRGDDADALHEVFADPLVMRHWNLSPSADLAETRQRIARSLAANPEMHAAWALVLPPGDRLIGLVNYHHREAANQRLEIGYLLARAHWGQGLMREALAVMLDHFFGGFDIHRVEATVEPENTASRRTLEHLGFRCESAPMRDRLKVGRGFRSVMMYALLASDRVVRRG